MTTYGSWLPGDPRGFRARHHREHVDGDYKQPPEQDYSRRHARSRKLCKAPPVLLTPAQRRIVVLAFHERLTALGVMVIAVGMSGRHGHILAKFVPRDVRRNVGHVKQHAYFALRDTGGDGFLWAKRCGVEPVESRSHQINALNYIVRHREAGACVWRWGDPIEDL